MNEEITGYKFRDIKNIFNTEITKQGILKAEKEGRIPQSHRIKYGNSNIKQRIWDMDSVSIIGSKYGFLNAPKKSTTTTVFSTKGGILKSTIVLNLARMYALHNVKTCLIDLDPQADSSRNLGFEIPEENISNLADLDTYYQGMPSLSDFYEKKHPLEEIIQNTELSSLDIILSSSDLIPFMDRLSAEVRREYWLKENVIKKLYSMGYQLVIIDLAPSWNIFTSNAITASDILVSPLECRIAHYRNHSEFLNQLIKFEKQMNIEKLDKLFIPTKFSSSKKISTQIKQYYAKNVEGCGLSAIRDSIIGEEAVAKRLSIIEYAPNKILSDDIREFLIEFNHKIS